MIGSPQILRSSNSLYHKSQFLTGIQFMDRESYTSGVRHRIELIAAILALAGALCAQSLPLDLGDQPFDPLADVQAKATVLVFVDANCPLSKRYTREIERLFVKFSGRGVSFWLVYPNPKDTAAAIRESIKKYGNLCPVLRDPEHALVKLAGVSVTPEAAVFVRERRMVYRGRIDDRFSDSSRPLPLSATKHDLEKVLEAVVAGKAPPHATSHSSGCPIAEPK
jgi:hypothetical protein